MIDRFILTLIFSLGISQFYSFSQNKSDYQWLFSNDYTDSLDGFEGNIIDFNSGTLQISEQQTFLQLDIINQSICDEETGELLFYTNGCAIANSNHSLMLNGDSLNYGMFFENWCAQGSPYPLENGTIILRQPNHSNKYYVIHQFKSFEAMFNSICGLNYSIVDLIGDDNKGEVILKNIQLQSVGEVQCGYTTACKSFNDDWWIIQISKSYNEYIFYQLNEEGLTFSHSQTLGPEANIPSSTGQGIFSPDGNKFMWFTPYHGITLLNFDRQLGLLSDYKFIEYPLSSTIQEFSGSCYFSSNSKVAYISTDLLLYQLNLEDENPVIELIAEWDGFSDPLPVGFSSGILGPDCRIYVFSAAGTKHFGVIHSPNKIGEECDFRQHENSLIWHKSRGTHPFFPNYRINEELPCNENLTSINEIIVKSNEAEIFPNPTKGNLNINFLIPLSQEANFSLYDLNGQLLKNLILKKKTVYKNIDVSELSNGIYVWKIQNKTGIVDFGRIMKHE